MTLFPETAVSAAGTDFELGVSGFRYSDLFDAARLKDLAETFYAELAVEAPVVHEALTKYIANKGKGLEKRAASNLLTDAAPYLSNFVARLFGISDARKEVEKTILEQNPIWRYKFFVQRRAIKKFKAGDLSVQAFAELEQALKELRNTAFDETLVFDEELAVSTIVARLLDAEESLTKGTEPLLETADTLGRLHLAFEKLKDKAFGKVFSQFLVDQEGTGDLPAVQGALQILEAWSAHEFYRKEKRKK